MKRKTFFLMFLSASALAAGCGNGVIRELPAMELPARELPAEETKFSFDDLQGLEFIFSSGAAGLGGRLCRSAGTEVLQGPTATAIWVRPDRSIRAAPSTAAISAGSLRSRKK